MKLQYLTDNFLLSYAKWMSSQKCYFHLSQLLLIHVLDWLSVPSLSWPLLAPASVHCGYV